MGFGSAVPWKAFFKRSLSTGCYIAKCTLKILSCTLIALNGLVQHIYVIKANDPFH